MYQPVLSWKEAAARQQAILNAVEIPPRRAQREARPRIPILARIVWARDGEEIIETEVWGWTTKAVHVAIRDPRHRTLATWLDPGDVQRLNLG